MAATEDFAGIYVALLQPQKFTRQCRSHLRVHSADLRYGLRLNRDGAPARWLSPLKQLA